MLESLSIQNAKSVTLDEDGTTDDSEDEEEGNSPL